MHTKAFVAMVASALLLACSNHDSTGFGVGNQGVSSGGGASTSGAGEDGGSGANDDGSIGGGHGSSGSSGGSSTGGASGGSSGGVAQDASAPGIFTDAEIADADIAQTVTLTADPFTVAAGDEVYMCQVVPNPFGADADIISMHGEMSVGSHHFFLFNMDPSTTGLNDGVLNPYAANMGKIAACPAAGLEFHPFPFLSQQPHWTVNYPTASDGSPMGYPLVAANSLMLNIHYLNTTSMAMNPTVSITIERAKPGVVKTHVGTIFLNQTSLSVPAGVSMSSPVPTTATWNGDTTDLPSTYSLYASISHMHQWGLDFTASTNGSVFYNNTNWSSPPLFIHNPVISMSSSQSITWTCSYYNDTGATLTFGDSAKSNIMCIYMGDYFPANATQPDVLASLK
jgi:hypothetical protein